MVRDTPRINTKEELPGLYAALKALGANNDERGERLKTNGRWVERFMERIPESLTPLIVSDAAPDILRTLLAEVEALHAKNKRSS